MNWLFNTVLIWLAIDLFMIGTIWYAAAILPQLWPNWWRHVMVDTVDREIRL